MVAVADCDNRLAGLIEAEYLEMPGMRLTERQIARLWNLKPEECRAVLDCLLETGRLRRDHTGQYFLPRSSC